ncbi:glycosyltransferase family 39 protein [Candidatus Micrarchaeota archaeon]|nr:glycosyltransferase family 39 protein [Candidatus Micrarchaeota archaeon]
MEKNRKPPSKNQKAISGRRILALFAILLLLGIYLRSNVFALMMNDELLYVATSLQHAGIFEGEPINNVHPPLAKLFFAATCMVQFCDFSAFEIYASAYPLRTGFPNVVEALQSVLPLMRLVSIGWSIATAGVVYVYTRKWFGNDAALFAFALMLVSPNMLLYSNVVMLESAFLFFFVTTYFFYLGTYREHRSPNNALILTGLLTAALLTRQLIPFILLPLLFESEIIDFIRRRHWDWKMSFIVFLSLSILITVYPVQSFNEAAEFVNYFEFGRNVNMDAIQMLASRLELAVILPLILGMGWLIGRKSPSPIPRSLGIGVLVLVAMHIWIGANTLRYVTAAFPLLYVLAGAALASLHGWKRALGVGLAGLLIVQAVIANPYYEQFTGISGLEPPENERTRSLGVHAFLLSENADKIITNDAYALPYAFDLPVEYILRMNGSAGRPITIQQACSYAVVMNEAMERRDANLFAFRKTGTEHLFRCPALYASLQKYPKVYQDRFYEVYQLE